MTGITSPEAIEDEIERTRARIDARMDKLSEDINPINVFARLTGSDSRSMPDTVSAAVNLARANPLAAFLAVAGAVGLFVGGNRLADTEVDSEPPRRPLRSAGQPDDPAKRVGRRAAVLKAQATTATRDAGDAAAGVARSVREGVASATEYVRDQAGLIAESASDGFASAAEEVSRTPRRLRVGSEQALEWVRENPLPTGLIAVALGAVAASFLAVRESAVPAANREGDRQRTRGRLVAPSGESGVSLQRSVDAERDSGGNERSTGRDQAMHR